MSDLTRYKHYDKGGTYYFSAAPQGEWVKADEAEARIAELEARLRAADELAGAIEAVVVLVDDAGADVALDKALTAYREAGK